MHKKRLNFVGIVFALCMVYLVIAQAFICFVNGSEYTQSAVNQRTDSVVIKKYRGKFLDTNGVPLVENSTTEFEVAEGKTALIPARYAPDSLARHLVGYVDSDGVGVSGLETCFEDVLSDRNKACARVVRSANCDVIGSVGMGIDEGSYLSDNVVLTIDSHIQRISENALSAVGATGAVVVLDAVNFEVLAMASATDFDQNNIQNHLYSDKGELINRCISPYNAGSVFKIITLSASSEFATLNEEYNCNGFIDVYDHRYACHLAEGHGTTCPEEALAYSCNCAFYTMGLGMGDDAVIAMARRFGMGESLLVGVDKLCESAGNIPHAEDTVFLDSINLSIGQGDILITPLQAAYMTAIIANGGQKKSLRLVKEIQDRYGSTVTSFDSQEAEMVISPSTCSLVSRAMRMAVTDGTAKTLADSLVPVAGKTGTAETGWLKDGKTLVHGWFCGFFPYDNPRYAVAVLIEDGGSGAVSALPVFKEIAEETSKIYPFDS